MSDEVTDGRHLMNPGPRWRSWAENQAERLKRRRPKRKDCEMCDGTGRIHSHNDICQDCEP